MREGWANLGPWTAAAEELGLEEVRGHGMFEGRLGDVLVRAWLRGHLRLRATVAPRGGLMIIDESGFSRFTQRFLGKDLQVGDALVDDTFHITTRYHPEAAQRLVASPPFRSVLSDAVRGGWQVVLVRTALDVIHPSPAGPHALREGAHLLVRLVHALDPEGQGAEDDRSSVQAVAERHGLLHAAGSVHGRVQQAWLRVDETTVEGRPHVRIQTTIPALLELTVRRREPGEPASGIGDPILDAAVRIAALSPESARELLCHEPARGCLLELVHGAGGTLDGGRLDLTVPDDPPTVLALIDAALTLREATDPPEPEAHP